MAVCSRDRSARHRQVSWGAIRLPVVVVLTMQHFVLCMVIPRPEETLFRLVTGRRFLFFVFIVRVSYFVTFVFFIRLVYYLTLILI